jgi:hypothetical protein
VVEQVARKDVCSKCVEGGRAGSCALYRCYCGHKECWASASYVKLLAPTLPREAPPKRDWKQRK